MAADSRTKRLVVATGHATPQVHDLAHLRCRVVVGRPGCACLSRGDPTGGNGEQVIGRQENVALAPYWCERLGRTELRAYQASARGGAMRVRIAGDRALLTGYSLTALRGELLL